MHAITPHSTTRTDALALDCGVLRSIEQGLNVEHPERSAHPARILGFGEISAVIAFDTVPDAQGWVFKRLPIFADENEAARHQRLTERYVELVSRIGVNVQQTEYRCVPVREGMAVFYAAQHALPSQHIGNSILHWATDAACLTFFENVLREIKRVWQFNASNSDGLEITLDLQLSNWAIVSPDEKPEITPETPLTYIDITTPLLRINGAEQLQLTAFIRGCPALLRWPVKRFMADGVVARYYDPRTCVMDVIGNCIKEGRGDLVPAMVKCANAFFARNPAGLEIVPLTVKEVFSYYRVDALIFVVFLALKRVDRFVNRTLLRRAYDHILPGRIQRNFPWTNSPKRQRT